MADHAVTFGVPDCPCPPCGPGGVVTECCPDREYPTRIWATITTNGTGGCGACDGTIPLDWNGSEWVGVIDTAPSGCQLELIFFCAGSSTSRRWGCFTRANAPECLIQVPDCTTLHVGDNLSTGPTPVCDEPLDVTMSVGSFNGCAPTIHFTE